MKAFTEKGSSQYVRDSKNAPFLQPLSIFLCYYANMITAVPIGILDLSKKANDGAVQSTSEPIYGGYANGRGQICLFGKSLVYRVNFKFNTVQQRPPLNPGAQARYDATEAGETFDYCSVRFRRLSNVQIIEICSSGSFRVTLRAT